MDHDDDADRLLDLLDLLLEWRGITPAGLAADLDRVLAVLALDTPAARTIVSAHFTGRHGAAWQTAYQEVTAAWQAAGLTPASA
ncbi:hypothetical protein [Streptomyces sp. SBT349]|uniref:hypothetical protein n=1 Tax=Streptomyces sp. SBT349 TaxID=1580539 RepID=UPI0018FE76FB|nr:hypothetical protein [Streptomyces sp. SBT349]